MNIIALTPETRGDVFDWLTHLVEVPPPGKGEMYPEFYCRTASPKQRWDCNLWYPGPSDGSFLEDGGYRFARRATESEIDATRAEASPSVGRDELVEQLVGALEASLDLWDMGQEANSSLTQMDRYRELDRRKDQIVLRAEAAIKAAGKGE